MEPSREAIEELTKDIVDLQECLKIAKRDHTKAILLSELSKLTCRIELVRLWALILIKAMQSEPKKLEEIPKNEVAQEDGEIKKEMLIYELLPKYGWE